MLYKHIFYSFWFCQILIFFDILLLVFATD